MLSEEGISFDRNVFHPPFVLHAYCITIFIKIPGPVCSLLAQSDNRKEEDRDEEMAGQRGEKKRIGEGKLR